jgi:hypothetical protein
MSTFFRQVSRYYWLQFQPETTPPKKLSYFAAPPGRFRAGARQPAIEITNPASPFASSAV